MHVHSKTCAVCGRRKHRSAFNMCSRGKGGLRSTCRVCGAAAGRRWYRRRQRKTSRLYSTYVGMKCRCGNPSHGSFRNYGGRGIRVCPEWLGSFEAFVRWSRAHGYRPGLQLDRKDNDKGYSPGNCRYVTVAENMRNKRPRASPFRKRTPTTSRSRASAT